MSSSPPRMSSREAATQQRTNLASGTRAAEGAPCAILAQDLQTTSDHRTQMRTYHRLPVARRPHASVAVPEEGGADVGV